MTSNATFKPWIQSLTLKSGVRLDLTETSVVFVVGPNNGGKSTFLREISSALNRNNSLLWFSEILWERGSVEQYDEYKARSLVDIGDVHNLYTLLGSQVHRGYVEEFYRKGNVGADVPRFLIHNLDAHERIKSADPVEAIRLDSEQSKHPYHQFYLDRDAELAFAEKIREAFGFGFCVNRTGARIGGHLGDVPDYDSLDIVGYEREIFTKLQPLVRAGDGIRCYAGILLNLAAKGTPVITLDEPEAFLHPPQARRLGMEIARAAVDTKQIFVATHSVEILQGALMSGSKDIRIVYVDHSSASEQVFSIDKSSIQEFSRNPFLSTTGALDAIFYSQAIVCEGEPDILFYRWALSELPEDSGVENWFWLSSYGKSYMPHVLRSLGKLGVNAKCVLDTDALLSVDVLKRICDARGFDLSPHLRDLQELKRSIKVPRPQEVLEVIERQVRDIGTSQDDAVVATAIAGVRRSAEELGKSWALKRAGLRIIPSGALFARIESLVSELQENGILILRDGEIENFAKDVGGHGQRWVQAVIEGKKVGADVTAKIGRDFQKLMAA